MKLQNFFQLAFFTLALILFTGCEKEDDAPKLDSTIYTESTDSFTGRASLRVQATTNGIASVGQNSFRWTKDKVWILDGFIFVNDGQTLTIEAGTVIKGKEGLGANSSALIVARGGKIIAEGTASAPIIFTAEKDKLDGSLGVQSGLWGGVIVLGKARLNSSPGESAIEGIPTSEGRGLYGGTQDEDNSGVLRYVSIRHGGTAIAATNEINGLTLGGVGSGTTLEYIEVFANDDDGIEWFGGTVNGKYLIVTACGDDGFDYDEGYRGNNQFGLIYQRTDVGNRGGEHDGGTDPEDGQPYALPKFYNVTSVGAGVGTENRALTFRDNAGGEYHNSIFVGYDRGVDIELLGSGQSSYSRFAAGELKLANNTFFNLVAGTTADKVFTVSTGGSPTEEAINAARAAFLASFAGNGNTIGNAGITRANVVPTSAGGSVSTPTSSFFTNTSYRGAFAPGATPWYNGWTRTADYIK